eukprot:TRINITY_DN102683_c0_g1_i1.p1 TRINITY_DN102683_c0_g1~~TRINITY_DN102683_c0_g1_i1.p1  ORF type:complete len:322 (+),score=61.26 TRINITY_DN102683_c0_g1_i1:59-1024(+)
MPFAALGAMARSGDPSLECTWEKLSKQITQCEYKTVAVELKAEEYVAKEKEREAQVLQRRKEITDAHEESAKSLSKEFDISMRALVNRTQQDVEEALTLQQQAVEQRDAANQKSDESEKQTIILEKEVKRLYTLLEQLEKEYDQKHERMRAIADSEVQYRMNEDDREVMAISLFAQEIQDDAFKSIDDYHAAISSSAEVAHAMAQSRSKYGQLAQISTSRAMEGISEQKFMQEKKRIMTQWWEGWEGHVEQLTPGPASLAQTTITRPNTPMKPTSPHRPRSVQIAREKALMYQTLQSPHGSSPIPLKPALPPVGDRPKTAP